MGTSTSLLANTTKIQPFNVQPTNTWITLTTTLLLLFGVFLFFVLLILYVFFTNRHLRQQARYVLFMYILVNDALYLFMCVLLFLLSLFLCYVPVLVCYLFIATASSTFLNTPNGLAVMALERYVAICFPLRHAQICQVQRSWFLILVISAVGYVPTFIDLLILISAMQQNLFLNRVLCYRESLIVTPQQVVLRFATDAASFSVAGLVILYTYIKIMQEAKKVNGDKVSSSKASRTVLLHAIQLLLCMTSFTAPFSEIPLLGNRNYFYIRFINFFMFMLVPIFLSPLIYGFRDKNFRTHIIALLTCQPHTLSPGEDRM